MPNKYFEVSSTMDGIDPMDEIDKIEGSSRR